LPLIFVFQESLCSRFSSVEVMFDFLNYLSMVKVIVQWVALVEYFRVTQVQLEVVSQIEDFARVNSSFFLLKTRTFAQTSVL